MEINTQLAQLSKEDYCYLTTTGRVSGRPHEIEIWFAAQGSTIYLLAGNKTSDWVRNLRKDPAVTVRLAQQSFKGIARVVQEREEELQARYRIAEKYQEWETGRTLSEWARTALPVAVDLTAKE